jgi:hypothetical protein
MKNSYRSLAKSFCIILILFFFTTENSLGQTFRINDVPGGSGSTTQDQGEADNTFIYVAAAVVIGGLIAYALLRDKKKEPEESDTSSVSSLINDQELFISDKVSNQNYNTANKDFPVDLIFGIRNEDALIPDKTYLLGVSVKF